MTNENPKREIEEFWGEWFANALKEYLGVDEVKSLDVDTDPPDVLYAILCRGKQDRIWAEITNVYPDGVAEPLFKEIRSQSSGEKRCIEVDPFAMKMDPDRVMAEKCKDAILKKIRKTTYASLCKEHGAGHLLLVIPYQAYPHVTVDTAKLIAPRMPLHHLQEQTTFHSVWVAYKEPDYYDGVFIIRNPTGPEFYGFVLLWPDYKRFIFCR